MDNGQRKRNTHRDFVKKTMESASKILIDDTANHVKDSSREKRMGLYFTVNQKLETTQKLDETILENAKEKDIGKEVENSGEFL